jgi:tRNA (guanine-N7-)-methyltransferase
MPASTAGPFELEIGFGRGRFLLERAAATPESRFVGIEISAKLAYLVEKRRIRLGMDRVVALAGDAREVLPCIEPASQLQRAFIHFPDPWWKPRHFKRNVVDAGLLDHLARLLVVGGELFVQTDVPHRFDDMHEQVREHGAFDIVPCVANPYGTRSNREARVEADGLPVHRILAYRRPSWSLAEDATELAAVTHG